VRELRNLMQRIALFLSVEPLQALTPAFLLKLAPELAHQSPTSGPVTALTNAPEADVAEVLARFDGNRAEAAAYLGISRTTLWRRIRSAHPK
jgi:propionate catabolism operon transcriptional regulator